MTPDELLLLFCRLRMAPVNGGRAIHKPLLVLFWLGRLERGEPRLARFVEVEARFKQLLTEFGSSNSPQTLSPVYSCPAMPCAAGGWPDAPLRTDRTRGPRAPRRAGWTC